MNRAYFYRVRNQKNPEHWQNENFHRTGGHVFSWKTLLLEFLLMSPNPEIFTNSWLNFKATWSSIVFFNSNIRISWSLGRHIKLTSLCAELWIKIPWCSSRFLRKRFLIKSQNVWDIKIGFCETKTICKRRSGRFYFKIINFTLNSPSRIGKISTFICGWNN